MASLISTTNLIKDHYWPLIKSRQTFLLTLTGIAGFLYPQPFPPSYAQLTGLLGSLLLTISGCSVLNMLFDRDIDRRMARTRRRPLANGLVRTSTATYLGAILVAMGLLWSAILSARYFSVILAGATINVLVYTLWLKRRTAWSILWGGVAGAMPILAGRTLAVGRVDSTGLLLGLIVMSWIPSHNLTLVSIYSDDYLEVGVPTFLSVYGPAITRLAVLLSGCVTSLLMVLMYARLNPPLPWLVGMIFASITLVGLAFFSWLNPSPRLSLAHYKYSSVYMLVCMLALALGGLL